MTLVELTADRAFADVPATTFDQLADTLGREGLAEWLEDVGGEEAVLDRRRPDRRCRVSPPR
jgi:hypothetical protein